MISLNTTARLQKFIRFLGGRAVFWLVLSALCGVVLSTAEAAAAGLLQILLQSINLAPESGRLPFGIVVPQFSPSTLALSFFLIAVIRAATTALVTYSATFANQIVQLRMNLLLFHEALDRPKGVSSLSELQFRMGTDFPKAVQFCNILINAIPNFINLLGLLSLLFLINWKAALISTLSIALIGFPTVYVNRRIRNRSHSAQKQMMALNHRVHSSVKNYFFLKALGMNEKILDDLVDQSLAVMTTILRTNGLASISANAPTALSGLLVAGLIYFQLQHSIFEAGSFIGFLYLFLRFGTALAYAGTHSGNLASFYPFFQRTIRYFFSFEDSFIQTSLTNMQRVHSIGLQHRERHSSLISAPITKSTPPIIDLVDVSFGYPGTSKAVIQKFNLRVPSGHFLGLKGESGSGKSTLVALMLGILKPDRGLIHLDSQDPSTYLRGNHSLAGYVGAEPFFIEGTLRDNLRFGAKREYFDDEMVKQLTRVHLWDDLVRQGMSLETKLSEFGEGLSAGQKQRLALARALLFKPLLLILDEATANLDEKNEAKIIETIETLKGAVTVIIISHRPGPLRLADMVVEIGS